MFKKVLLVLILGATLITVAQNNSFAQTVPGQKTTYSLEDCLRIALKENTDIRSSEANLPAAAAAVEGAFGSYLPSLDYGFGYTRQLNPIDKDLYPSTDPNSLTMNLSSNYVIYNASRSAYYERSKKALGIRYEELNFTQLTTVNTIYRLYNDVIRKMQIINIRKDNLEYGRKELEKSQAQFDAGLIHVGIVYTQEAELGSREIEVVNAENDVSIAKANLLKAMGLLPTAESSFLESSLKNEITVEDIKKFRSETGSFDDALKYALAHRKDYTVTQSSIEVAKSGIDIAKSGYYPTLTAGAAWNWNSSKFTGFTDNTQSRFTIGVNLAVPIFDNFSTNLQVENAKLDLTLQEIRRYETEQTIRTAIQTSMLNLEAIEKQIEIIERTVKAADLNLQNYKDRFDNGAANITEYLDANNRFVTAKLNRVNTIYSYYQAQQELLYAIGKIELTK